MTDAAITGEPYEPADAAREAIDAYLEAARVEYDDETDLEAFGTPAKRVEYRVIYDDEEIEVTETQAVVGVLVSARGAIGMLAATILANARTYGVPTLVYTDDLDMGALGRYQDLSAEWYRPEAQDERLLERRRNAHDGREDIGLDLLEDVATTYLE